MKSLWFKAEFVAAILDGSKCDTIRRASNRLPAAGERVALSVGPRAPFAYAEIVSVKRARIPAARRAAVAKIYGDAADLITLRFRLLPQNETNTS